MVASTEISVDGLDEVLRNLRKIGVEATDLKQINFEAGLIVARKAKPPVDEGDLATTLRVAKATNKAKVTVGSKTKGFYSTFIEYGTVKLDANPFLLEAKNESLPEIYDHYEKGIDDLISRYNLN
jgi:HK97 gp10 family phage protein